MICADPDAWYRTSDPAGMGAGNHADVWAALRDPAVVHGMCEDYRAGLGIDRAHDEADRAAGRRITCPTLLLESADVDLDIHGDPAAIWAPWLAERPGHPGGKVALRQVPDGVSLPGGPAPDGAEFQEGGPWSTVR